MKSTTHICTECQVPREEGGGCYTFCEGKRFIPIQPKKNLKIYKGYIQHWHCGSGYQMAIILNTEGKFHRTTLDKIWVEKEDMPTTKE